MKSILVTGAAGFVGSHTIDLLVEGGYQILALDCLDPQIHGEGCRIPRNLARHSGSKAVRFLHGDVRDRALLERAVTAADAILHLAAAVGVGQSMYMPHHYADVNVGGTALLMDILANSRHKVRKIVVASSMSIYGEGAYRCDRCGPVYPGARNPDDLAAHRWDHNCPECAAPLRPVPTPESKPLHSTSVYAITKKVQEEMLLVFGQAYRLPVIALRYFNIYGPRQSLNNPYTGVAAIFLSQLLSGQAPHVFEDGLQSRDFIHVRDIARANLLALEAPVEDQRVYNVGSGTSMTVRDLAGILNASLGTNLGARIANQFRTGDIRHCYADSSKIAADLGFHALVRPEEGFGELIAWSRTQAVENTFARSLSELQARSLVE